MKKFIVERKLPGAGNMTSEELKDISTAFNSAASSLGKQFTWLQSFVTEDKIYCIHVAENENDIRDHARRGNFHVHVVEEIKAIIDPSNAGNH